ncbi:MotE family protein [Fervidibacillus halotolerans]|uniref:MotE family protein n=1 Tax=Fervidibacillus halotolerans TaxID=2980027 RepID=A0A9E8M1D5_9BACI|nr:MotE family protein [Fervidibacillus halotolerans]WAA13602.1 MotE family protein [Fervidibacillus halotolerans]
MRKEKEKKKKKFGIFQWIVFGGIFPILIALSILLIVLSIQGINVFKETEKIPVIGNFLGQEKNDETSVDDLENTIRKLQAELKNEEAKSSQLQSKLEDKEKEIAQLEEEKKRLERDLNELMNSKGTTSKNWDSVIKTYETMKPKEAALILVEMDENTALNILADLSEDQLADILEKMPPQDAAQFTNRLAELEKSQ